MLVTAFHPELTDDTRLHELFIRMIRRRQGCGGRAGRRGRRLRRRRARPGRRRGRPTAEKGGGVLVSGHSKWATIKHKKGKTDARRGKLFSQAVARHHGRRP